MLYVKKKKKKITTQGSSEPLNTMWRHHYKQIEISAKDKTEYKETKIYHITTTTGLLAINLEAKA